MVTRHSSLITRHIRRSQSGFTLIEILLVMTIIAIIVSFATINLLKPQIGAGLDSIVATVVADLKEQQIKSMVADTEGSGPPGSFGVRFESDRYILFKDSYPSPNDFTINLDPSLTFSPTGQEFIFARRSGDTTQGSITITHQSGDQQIISINSLGAIDIN